MARPGDRRDDLAPVTSDGARLHAALDMTEQLVTAGMVLLEERAEARDVLWCVARVSKPDRRGRVTAKLLAFSGRNTGDERTPWATAEATATFPDGKVRSPFYHVTVDDVDIPG